MLQIPNPLVGYGWFMIFPNEKQQFVESLERFPNIPDEPKLNQFSEYRVDESP